MRCFAVAVLIAASLLAAGLGHAGDDDKPPAYRIYIDPETGKYTTEDPLAGMEKRPVVRAVSQPSTQVEAGQRTAAVLSAALIIGLLVAGFVLYRRQPKT